MLDAEPNKDTLLEVNNIEVIYDHVILVLKGVSLSVPKGGITALLGGNGAGKSTTLKAISNLLRSELLPLGLRSGPSHPCRWCAGGVRPARERAYRGGATSDRRRLLAGGCALDAGPRRRNLALASHAPDGLSGPSETRFRQSARRAVSVLRSGVRGRQPVASCRRLASPMS